MRRLKTEKQEQKNAKREDEEIKQNKTKIMRR